MNGEIGKKAVTQRTTAYRGFRDLTVYQAAYELAKEIHERTKQFPPAERYSLTDQIRRSSRSVVAHVAEAWKHRLYPSWFRSKLVDASGEAAETEVWLDFSRDWGYLDKSVHADLIDRCDQVERMLYTMTQHPERFCR